MTPTVEEREIIRVFGLSLGTQTVRDQELLPLLEQIQKVREEMQALYTKAEVRIIELQAQCPHTNTKDKFDINYSSLSKRKLLSRQCTDCGFHFTKPEGMPWIVCEIYWGTMKHVETTPGQGYRTEHYECTTCGHHESHT